MSGLPSHWDERALGEVVDFVRGVTYKKTQSRDTEQDGFVPLLRATNIAEDGLTLTDFVYVPENAVKPHQWLRSGDTLLATSSGSISVVGKSGLATMDGAYTFGAFCGVLRPSEAVDPSFLAYFAKSTAVRRRWSDAARGTNINNLKADVVMSTPIPLPPLDEQQRIVAILEEHLSRLDASTRSIGASADMAISLIRRAMVDLLRVPGERLELNQVLGEAIGGLWGDPPGESELDVRVLRVTELKKWGLLDPSTAAIRSIKRSQYTRRSLQVGDLLLEKSGGGPTTPVGRVGLVSVVEGPSVCSNFMQLMRPEPQIVHSRWLHLYLNAMHLVGRTNSMQKASTNIRNIKASDYLRMAIEVPSLAVQERLVSECESWMAIGTRLQESVAVAEARSTRLRSSLLQAAFAGHLTKESSLV